MNSNPTGYIKNGGVLSILSDGYEIIDGLVIPGLINVDSSLVMLDGFNYKAFYCSKWLEDQVSKSYVALSKDYEVLQFISMERVIGISPTFSAYPLNKDATDSIYNFDKVEVISQHDLDLLLESHK